MNKLAYLKSARQRFNNSVSYSQNTRMATYQDRFLDPARKVPFKHSWGMLAHMYDLRMWVLTYAPPSPDQVQKMQELHRINSEMWYLYSDALWKRIIAGVGLYFLTTKIFKHRFANRGKKDSHDVSYRDTVGHL